MRTLFRLTAVASALVAGAPAARAQTPGDTLRLTLTGVLARVEEEHPVTRAAAQMVRAARARAAQLTRLGNPTIEIDRATLSAADNVALRQPVRWPAERRALRDVGNADVAVAIAEGEGDVRAIAREAAQRFADGIRSVRAVVLAVEAESLAQRAVERATSARELGQAGDLAVLQAQVSLDGARRARAAAEATQEAVAGSLALMLGFPAQTSITFAGDLESLSPLAGTDSVLARATAADPATTRLRREADRAAAEARLARARRWPELELGPAAGLGESRTLGLSVGVGIPLWNRQSDALRAARADGAASLARMEARRREVAVLVEETRVTLARAQRELALLRSGELARAAQAESLAVRALGQGGPYLVAWLAARQAYLDARRAELDLVWQAARARLLLRSLVGDLTSKEGDR